MLQSFMVIHQSSLGYVSIARRDGSYFRFCMNAQRMIQRSYWSFSFGHVADSSWCFRIIGGANNSCEEVIFSPFSLSEPGLGRFQPFSMVSKGFHRAQMGWFGVVWGVVWGGVW